MYSGEKGLDGRSQKAHRLPRPCTGRGLPVYGKVSGIVPAFDRMGEKWMGRYGDAGDPGKGAPDPEAPCRTEQQSVHTDWMDGHRGDSVGAGKQFQGSVILKSTGGR